MKLITEWGKPGELVKLAGNDRWKKWEDWLEMERIRAVKRGKSVCIVKKPRKNSIALASN